MRRICKLAAGLLLLFIPAANAQQPPREVTEATLLRNFDVTATSFAYQVYGDRNASTGALVTGVLGPGTVVNKKVKTTGSQNNPVPSPSGTEPYRGLAVGDLLLFPNVPGIGAVNPIPTEQERNITTFTDSNTVVLDSNIDLTNGVTFRFKKLISGAAAGDAWFSVQGFDKFQVQFDVNTINATNLIATLECRVSPYAATNTVFTSAALTAVSSTSANVTAPFDQCRVGWKVTGDAGVQSVSTYIIAQR